MQPQGHPALPRSFTSGRQESHQGELLDQVLRRETWATDIGVTLVELDHPRRRHPPVRAFYDPAARDPGIGINPVTYPGKLWYLLPDIIAAALLGDHVPVIAQAWRLVGVDRQPDLRPVPLRGGRECSIPWLTIRLLR